MNNYLPTDYQSFIHCSRYARWLEDEGRRESWPETVARYLVNVVAPKDESMIDELEEAVRRVHDNNLGRCIQPDGSIQRRADGKILKNKDYPKVDLTDLI